MYSFAAEYKFIWLLEMYSSTKNMYSLKNWMGLLNKYSVETEYVFSWNWIWQNHMFSLHVGRIQLQLNTYSVAPEYVFSCLPGSYSVAYMGRIQPQLTTYSAATESSFFQWHVYCAPDMVTRVSFLMDTWIIWIHPRRRRFRCFRRCCCWCWLAI